MNNLKTTIWGRELDLDVVFDVFDGKTINENQNKAFNLFIENIKNLDNCLQKVKEYCIENSNEQIKSVDNIFKYIMPKTIYVINSFDENRTVALLCNFKFDMEHGMAIVFKNEEFSELGDQSLII